MKPRTELFGHTQVISWKVKVYIAHKTIDVNPCTILVMKHNRGVDSALSSKWKLQYCFDHNSFPPQILSFLIASKLNSKPLSLQCKVVFLVLPPDHLPCTSMDLCPPSHMGLAICTDAPAVSLLMQSAPAVLPIYRLGWARSPHPHPAFSTSLQRPQWQIVFASKTN